MTILQFRGEVFPKTRKVTISESLTCRWDVPGKAHTCEFSISIVESDINVHCNVSFINDRYSIEYVRKRAESLCQTALDLCVLSCGIALHAVLDRYVYGERILVVDSLPFGAAARCRSVSLQTIGEAWPVVTGDIYLFMALNDLTRAVSDPHLIAVNCGRILESIRKSNSNDILKIEDQWGKLRSSLRISREYIQYIMSASIDPRHGKRFGLEDAVLKEVLARTWVLIDRYIELKKRNLTCLPEEEFSIL